MIKLNGEISRHKGMWIYTNALQIELADVDKNSFIYITDVFWLKTINILFNFFYKLSEFKLLVLNRNTSFSI